MQTAPILDAATPPAAARSAGGTALQCNFAQMRLRVGEQMYLELPRMLLKERAAVTLIGWVEGQSVLVTAPQKDSLRLLLQSGERVVLRTFAGTNAFAFPSQVIRPVNSPFHYLHLSFPDKVDSVAIRSSARCRLGVPAKISAGGTDGDCTIANIGTNGALIESAQALQKDVDIKLSIALDLHGVPVTLDVAADVRSIKSTASGEGGMNQYGVQFRDLKPNDRLVLGSVVCYHLLQDPQSVT